MAKGQTFPVARSEERQLFLQPELVSPCFQVLCMGGGGGQQIILTNLFMGWSTKIISG